MLLPWLLTSLLSGELCGVAAVQLLWVCMEVETVQLYAAC